jgi:hypothetical protein
MGKCVVAMVSVVALAAAGSAWGAPSRPPRAVVVNVGRTRAFTAAELRPGGTVRCVDGGHSLSLTAPPVSPATSVGTVWTQAGTRHFHLYVDVKSGGGYQVACGLGGSHWAPAVGRPHRSTPARPSNPFLVL